MMNFDIESYKTIVFDCDGVVLNSNKIKTQAFFRASLPYGKASAEAMVAYHVANGGVSRYEKFAYFIERIAPIMAPGVVGPGLDSLLRVYAEEVHRGLLSSAVAGGLDRLRVTTATARWLIVSGGDQAELHEIFARRNLADRFDGGIFGSPDSKDEILVRELENGNIQTPALFLGDSKYDHQAAKRAGLNFIFVSDWSEFGQWREYCEQHSIPVISKLSDLLPSNKGVS